MENHPPFRPSGTPHTDERNVAYLDHVLWQQLTEAETDEAFCHSWLTLQGRMIGGVSSGMVVLGPADQGPFTPVTFWPREQAEMQNLARVTERALKERKGVVIREKPDDGSGAASDDGGNFLVAYPVRVDGKLHGVAALEIVPRPHDSLQSVMRQLQWGVAWLENRLIGKQVQRDACTRTHVTTALDLAAAALQQERFQAAATAFATLLATRLGCDRVSIGFLKGKHVKVHALSHSSQFKKQMNLIRAIGAAMDESVDQRASLVYPEASPEGNRVLRAHAALVQQQGDGAVCTIPFLDKDGNGFGALTLERSAERPFTPEEIELCDSVAALVAPILDEKRKNDHLLITKIGISLKNQLQKLTGPRHMALKLVAAVVLTVIVAVSVISKEYRVTAKTTIEGEVQRAVVAPFDGYIFEASVRAGDIVEAGTLMCRMDDRDLILERIKGESQREQYERQHREAMASGNRANVRILREQISQAEAQLALIHEQLSRATIVAPFKGVVVSGDLSQSLGSPVERGKVLFEVAPLENYRVRIQVDEREIGWIAVDQRGELVLNSLPETAFPIVVTKITPVSAAEEGNNYFLVEATVEGASDRLRPGMEGFSKVHVGKRRLIWILTHDLIDWLRLRVWSWLP